MIPSRFVTQWSKTVNWQTPAQVEQDLVLSRAIIEIFSNPRLAKTMRFRGGTALYKLFFNLTTRYSEDIDLVQALPGPIGEDIDEIRKILDPWLGEPRRKRGPGIVSLVYQFRSEDEDIPLRLKVEINTREHEEAFSLITRPFKVESEWFNQSCEISTYSLEELMGSKLKALYSRKKGRDLFDCWIALKDGAIDISKTIDAFSHYLKFSDQSISRAEFEKNLFYKLQDASFRKDIEPILVVGSGWDIEIAATQVSDKLISQLSGNKWQGES